MKSNGEQKPGSTPVIDYEHSNYRQDFWEGQGREYEDAVERTILRHILPRRRGRIAEIGAGFGRLADLYAGYDQIVLFDYSRTLLADAVDRWGDDERFVFVAGNVYQLPLATGSLDALVMVRVMHHLADVPGALVHIERVLHSGSRAVLEYANKRNLKAIGRWLFGRQDWSPFAPDPIEFVELNFDFHPAWMEQCLSQAGLVRERRYAASHFRLPALKQNVPADLLTAVERPLFSAGGLFPLSPSIFVRLYTESVRASLGVDVDLSALFRCPHCSAEKFEQIQDVCLQCSTCGRRYTKQGGIWDFKEPERPV